MQPKTEKHKQIFERGRKHYADRNVHTLSSTEVPEPIPFKNPFQPKTMEYYFFNQGYLSEMNKKA